MKTKRRVLLLLSAYDPETHHAAVEAARTFDWHLDTNVLSPVRMVDHWQGDGILCSLGSDARQANFVQRAGIPAVDLSNWRSDLQLPRVSADNHAIGKLAAEHFLHYAHQHFAWFGSTRTPYGEARYEGLQSALSEHGFSVERIDGRGSQDYATVARRIQKLPRPCAILTLNDADAGWLASLCLQEGYHVPMDFAILGIDNNPLVCEVQSVPISSIDKDATRITRAGAALLQDAMNGAKTKPTTEFIAPRGVITRASSDAFALEDELIRSALRELHENLASRIGTPEIAAKLGVSRSTLNQRFQSVLKISLHQYLLQLRLRTAAEYLSTSELSAEEIASRTGFTHGSHLSNAFKRHYGQSPMQHRKQMAHR